LSENPDEVRPFDGTDPDPKHQRAAKEYVSTIIKIYNSLDVKGYSL
jgi:hypothetical protein